MNRDYEEQQLDSEIQRNGLATFTTVNRLSSSEKFECNKSELVFRKTTILLYLYTMGYKLFVNSAIVQFSDNSEQDKLNSSDLKLTLYENTQPYIYPREYDSWDAQNTPN